ncbi:MAG: NAD(P)H-hydrate epimerase [Planctomycetes bacterium]|nr:NAD(P)H-hydrate epimerase [Planctomycetota bacterium]
MTDAESQADALTSAQLRELDRLAIEECGLPGVVLMENAGAGAARVALRLLAGRRAPRVWIAAGPGQNGGDGWVVARWLANAGADVRVASALDPRELRGDAGTHARVALAMGIGHERLAASASAAHAEQLARADLVVDALLGTGARGAPRGVVGAAVAALEALAARAGAPPVLALDLPSGLDPDTGARPGACVRAAITATFAARKVGFEAPGVAAWLGEIEVVDIGVPRALFERVRGS